MNFHRLLLRDPLLSIMDRIYHHGMITLARATDQFKETKVISGSRLPALMDAAAEGAIVSI